MRAPINGARVIKLVKETCKHREYEECERSGGESRADFERIIRETEISSRDR